MPDTEQLNQQVDLLVEMLDGIAKTDDDILYLIEIKDETNLSKAREQLAAAKEKAKLVIGAISRRSEILDKEHAKIFKEITG